jgi:hypothetical protein
VPTLSGAEAAAYDAPFADASYKAGVRAFPRLVMTEPGMPGVEISRTAQRFWSGWKGASFLAVGAQDPCARGAGDGPTAPDAARGAAGAHRRRPLRAGTRRCRRSSRPRPRSAGRPAIDASCPFTTTPTAPSSHSRIECGLPTPLISVRRACRRIFECTFCRGGRFGDYGATQMKRMSGAFSSLREPSVVSATTKPWRR